MARRRIGTALALVLVLLATASCRDEEQGRPLHFDKGHYAGEPVERPSKEALNALHDRVLRQQF